MMIRRSIFLPILCATALDAGAATGDAVRTRPTQDEEEILTQDLAQEHPAFFATNGDGVALFEGGDPTASVFPETRRSSSSLVAPAATADKKAISTNFRAPHAELNGRRLRGKSKKGSSKSSKSKRGKGNKDKDENKDKGKKKIEKMLKKLEDECLSPEDVACEFFPDFESPEDSFCECEDEDDEDKVGKTVEELEEECYADEDEVCVFFPDLADPPNSDCRCVPSAFSPDDLSGGDVGIFSACELGKTITEYTLEFGGVVLGVLSAFATFPLTVVGAPFIGWTLAAAAPGALSPLMDLWTCNSNELLIGDLEETEAFVGPFFDQFTLDGAVDKMNSMNRYIRTLDDVDPPLYEVLEVIRKIEDTQTEASRSKALGANVVAQMGTQIVYWWMQKLLIVERRMCPGEIDRFKEALKDNLRLLDRIKTEFNVTNFDRYVRCHTGCYTGGCLCFFCGNKRVETHCNTPELGVIESENGPFNFVTEYCEQCDAQKRYDEGMARIRADWSERVDEWWERDVEALYVNTTRFLEEEVDKLDTMCGQQCGPQVLVNGIPQAQSCKCEGGLRYCNLEIGRCDGEKKQPDSSYDCQSGVFQ